MSTPLEGKLQRSQRTRAGWLLQQRMLCKNAEATSTNQIVAWSSQNLLRKTVRTRCSQQDDGEMTQWQWLSHNNQEHGCVQSARGLQDRPLDNCRA